MSLRHSGTDPAALSTTDTTEVNGRLPGGSYAPEQDSVFYITPPGERRFAAYVPAGIEMSYLGEPSFVEVPDGPTLPDDYCPVAHEVFEMHEQEAISNEILKSPFTFRVHHGPNDSDTYDHLPAGTRIQTALWRCRSCQSTAANPTTRPASSIRVDDQSEEEIGSAAELDSPKASHQPAPFRIPSTVFWSSQMITPEGEDYRCASDITVSGEPTGKGYFLVQPSGDQGSGPAITVHDAWEKFSDTSANQGETAVNTIPGRGKPFPARAGRYHGNIVTVEFPVLADKQTRPNHTIRTGDQTHISDVPIPNEVLRQLFPDYNP